ncbi:uncharacterized protein LOC128210957 [Mya arenaria]|uniref:uncharacterized protein LOC128210957 n=1 Tax=Mya arenaria TaxID=6604 RepID=UPI0022E7BA56|nr:uncharacterized protein LOC128210957 [Mya arenaria]
MSTQRMVLHSGAEIVTLLGVAGTAEFSVSQQASVAWTMVAQSGYVARADVCSVSREGDADIVLQNGCSNEEGRMSDFQYTGMENSGRKYTMQLVPKAFESGSEEVSILCSVRQCPLADTGDCDFECGENTRRQRRSAFGVESFVAILKLRFNKSQADGTIMTTGRMQPNVETIDFLSAGSPICRVSISALWILSSILIMCQVG